MKRALLTIVLMSAVLVASGACRGTARTTSRPDTKKIVNTVKTKRTVKCKSCTAFKCENPKKRRYAKR